MGASRFLVGIVCFGLLAGCASRPDSDVLGDDDNLSLEAQDAPDLPAPPAGATCALIQRDTAGAVEDSDVGYGNGPDWCAGALPYSWTGVSPYDHWSLYQFDIKSVVPSNANIVLGVFSNYASGSPDSATVRAHRILDPWTENTVTWNNFGGVKAWDPAVLGSMDPSGGGFRSIHITGMVQDWHSGAADNYGILLEEDPVFVHHYFSSEVSTIDRRPSLYVCWVEQPEEPSCVEAGGGCEASSDCCEGSTCVEGTCEAEVPVCQSFGGACQSNSDCCNGFVCNDFLCLLPAAACAGPNDVCSDSVPCCNGATCNEGSCDGGPSVCSAVGSLCSDDGECCSGSCGDGLCVDSSAICVNIDYACSSDADCYGGSCINNACRDASNAYDECNPEHPCCGGAACVWGSCWSKFDVDCVAAGGAYDGTIDCCWGLDGSSGTCQ